MPEVFLKQNGLQILSLCNDAIDDHKAIRLTHALQTNTSLTHLLFVSPAFFFYFPNFVLTKRINVEAYGQIG